MRIVRHDIEREERPLPALALVLGSRARLVLASHRPGALACALTPLLGVHLRPDALLLAPKQVLKCWLLDLLLASMLALAGRLALGLRAARSVPLLDRLDEWRLRTRCRRRASCGRG